MIKINIMKYANSLDFFIGEVMGIDNEYIEIMLYPDRYRNIRLSTPLLILSDSCGSISFSITNIIRAKYGKEFALIRRRTGEETSKVYPDIHSHYNYVVKAYNLYHVSPDGEVIARKGCNPSPHDPVYYLDKEDIKKILFNPMFNSDILRLLIEANPTPSLIREFLAYIKEVNSEYDLRSLLSEMLSALYRAGYRKLDLFIRDFKEVFLNE